MILSTNNRNFINKIHLLLFLRNIIYQKAVYMKSNLVYINVLITMLILSACSSSDRMSSQQSDQQLIAINENGNFSIYVKKGKSFDHPTLVIWTEDVQGNFLETIYISKSYASGVYSHEMVGDTSWLRKQGPSYQPAALPYWTHKKGPINGQTLIPTPNDPYVDAYTGPTPKGSFIIKYNDKSSKPFEVLMEINQFGDWNRFWTNSKYSESKAYSHSAQPSVIYSVTITDSDSVFYLNPIGHGDPEGTSDKLYTNLSTLTTALKIVEQIKVTTK